MNKIIKKFVMFVLPFLFLFINVSYAIESNYAYSYKSYSTSNNSSILDTDFVDGYTKTSFKDILKNYIDYPEEIAHQDALNKLISDYESAGKNVIVYTGKSSATATSNACYFISFDKELNISIASHISESYGTHHIGVISNDLSSTNKIYIFASNGSFKYDLVSSPTNNYGYSNTVVENIVYSSVDVYELYKSGSTYIWDGTSYFYKPESDTPSSLPSNSEIAQVVQAFYNTDYYKNNKDFNDFIVMYNVNTKYFDFIGHTLGDSLGQVIIPPNYRYQGKLYNEQWWKFFIDENQGAIPYGTSYYLCSTNNFGQHFINEGVGKISELVSLDFSTKSVIVYSTSDYPVRTYVLNEETGDYTYTDGVIEGDQYTYDENLDPTISGYNPLENFVPTNPSQTILGDVDFNEINKIFEENKDILNIEGASWLFTANNQFINYFIGFLSLLIVFLIISRILGG